MPAIPKAKKSLGQHFLNNEGVITKIADLIEIDANDAIIEIGPGPGALTKKLVERAPAKLQLIEIDDYWAEHHARELAESPNVAVLHMDAMKFMWETLVGPWKVVGNLPYNVASPLMWDIVYRVPNLTRAVFMIQKEVAERLWAEPGSKKYGAISAWIQSFVHVGRGFTVGPGNFSPPPKVDSAVVCFTPRTARPACNESHLAATLKMCFGQRRKQLQTILHNNGIADAEAHLSALGIAPTARPETLPPPLFQQLAERLFARQ